MAYPDLLGQLLERQHPDWRTRASTRPFCAVFAGSYWSVDSNVPCLSDWWTTPRRRERGTVTPRSGAASGSCFGLHAYEKSRAWGAASVVHRSRSTREAQSIDWSDPEARAAHLKEIIEDARTALSLAECAGSATPAANEAAALLSKIDSDDVEESRPQDRSGEVGRPRKTRRSPTGQLPGSRIDPPPRIPVPGCAEGWPGTAS